MNPDAFDFSKVRIDPAWALRIPDRLALRQRVLPFASLKGKVYVACDRLLDAATRDALARHIDLPLEMIQVDADVLQRALAEIYGDGRSRPGGISTGGEKAGAGSEDTVRRVDEMILAAILRQASDIHLDPERDSIRLRFRVDGVLEEYQRLPSDILRALCSRIKVMAGMDIAERRAPQDGGFSFRYGPPDKPRSLDVRVASLPVRHGERMTMRLLPSQDRQFSLEALGMRTEHLSVMERVLSQPHGLVLLTGPTGSGKSTTLYAAIQRLQASRPLNILTVEDPIEYEIGGVGQAEIDSADKVSFHKALRSLLRHDPDIVMIGEIRDSESLDVAIKASLTGHLVLSTLHTNDAAGVVTRLLDMGIPSHLVAATLRLGLAQRLVRRLCSHCATPRDMLASEAAALQRPELTGSVVYDPAGCLYCAGRGYVGRTGLFECLSPDAETSSVIAANVSESKLREHLAMRGHTSLLDDAVGKLADGVTTVNEILESVATFYG